MGCSKDIEKSEINISVAASLLKPMEEITESYKREVAIDININSGGSGVLEKQIEEGAPIDLFFSASEGYVDTLKDKGLVFEENIDSPLTNSLVLIKSNSSKDEFLGVEGMKALDGLIAIGDENLVPAGIYSKEALENLGLYKDIKEKLVSCKSVSLVKSYVEKGQVDYGFIYKSDATDLKNSKVVYEVDKGLHSNIIYELATILEGNKEVERFKSYILSDSSMKIFEKYGFEINKKK